MTDPRIMEILHLINDQNHKIITLLETQAKELIKIESAIKITLSHGFLENEESTIYSHLSMVDDFISIVINLNETISRQLKQEETIG